MKQAQEESPAESKLIYLGSGTTAEQQGIPKTVEEPKLGSLSESERLQLRKARFRAGGGIEGPKTSLDALASMEEQKKKQLERAARFGIQTKEMSQIKLKERQQRFGIETKESLDAKREERRKRFAESLASSDTKEDAAKRAARLERFGKEAIEEAKNGEKPHDKFHGKKRNFKHKSSNKPHSGGPHKRFKKQ